MGLLWHMRHQNFNLPTDTQTPINLPVEAIKASSQDRPQESIKNTVWMYWTPFITSPIIFIMFLLETPDNTLGGSIGAVHTMYHLIRMNILCTQPTWTSAQILVLWSYLMCMSPSTGILGNLFFLGFTWKYTFIAMSQRFIIFVFSREMVETALWNIDYINWFSSCVKYKNTSGSLVSTGKYIHPRH